MRNLLTSYWRSLTHRPGFALLNIGGLALGIAVFVVLALFVRFETGFDRWWPGAGQTYVVQDTWTLPGIPETTSPNTMGGLVEQLRADFSGLIGTYLRPTHATLRTADGGVVKEPFALVDADFFRVFDWPFAAGSARTALLDPASLVVNETFARRYFGTAAPLGRTITLTVEGNPTAYRVSAVMRDLPENSEFNREGSMHIHALARFHYVAADNPQWYHWGSEQLFSFLRFPTRDAAHAFERGLKSFVDRRGETDSNGTLQSKILRQSLLPVPSMHLREASDRATVTTLGLVGALALLIAVVNYINLSTARAALRAREVAVRKALGATRAALARQFIGEAVLTAALAALAGLALVEVTLPFVNALGGTTLSLVYFGTGGVLIPLAILAVVTGAVAGFYPALVLSGFQPAAVLASARTPGGGRSGTRVREALVVIQFAIAIALTIGTLVLVAQVGFLRAADIGFKRDGLMLVTSYNDSGLSGAQRSALLARFRGIPGVVGATQADSGPAYTDSTSATDMKQPGHPSVMITYSKVGEDYFTVYGARLLAGRLPSVRFGADEDAGAIAAKRGVNVILNESAVRALGFASPAAAIGGQVEERVVNTVVGVIADMRFRSPRAPVPPTLYFFTAKDMGGNQTQPVAALRFAATDPRVLTERLRRVWLTAAPGIPFTSVTARENLTKAYYRADEQRTRLFTAGAVLAVVIGAIGLYGLAAFNTGRRVREIGIRKTLGASTGQVLRLLVGAFLRPVLIANVVAWPLAYVAMRSWLAGFDQHVGLGISYFIIAAVLAVAIAVATVIGQSVRVARSEPARALRYE